MRPPVILLSLSMKKSFSTACASALLLLLAAATDGQAALPTEQVAGRLGVAISLNGQKKLAASHAEEESFALMSVMKFPLALTILHQVEQGKLSLEQEFELTPSQLDADTWSPLLKRFPQGGTFTLAELLRFCVAESDNNACNVLFSLAGGPEAIRAFLSRYPDIEKGITIVCSEEAFHDRRMMRANHATPKALCLLLRELHLAAWSSRPPEAPLLERELARWLWEVMATTPHGKDCLKAALPPEAVLAHKTGSSGRAEGVTLALNDVGIILLPDGRFACVATFVGDSPDSREKMAKALADVAREALLLLQGSQPGERE